MYRRTFEVLSKFISKENGVTIQFSTDGGANADMKNNILHLPKDIADKHAYAAVSLMMHESAHIKHSKIIPIEQIVKTKGDFHILNAIEDIRIDKRNFQVLPNVHEFYGELMQEVKATTDKTAPLPARALCSMILYLEGFNEYKCFGRDAYSLGLTITGELYDGMEAINKKDWATLRRVIDDIKIKLGIPPDQDPPMPQPIQMGVGSGPCSDNGASVDPKDILGKVEVMIHPKGILSSGQGKGMGGGSCAGIGEIAMDEQCANQFKEILNIKERKHVSDGNILDTDNLVDFFTGDVESLFKEEKVVKKKKSKIMFLLDASGSMHSKLMDGKTRAEVVSKSVGKMTKILNEVIDLEGIDIDWGIGAFQDGYIPLDKDTWQMNYCTGGGTSFAPAFIQTMEDMLKDYSIDGKRIIIVMTDGDVSDREIDEVKESITRNYNDVRSLIISVGSNISSAIAKELTGDNIIVSEDNALYVIMECVKSLL